MNQTDRVSGLFQDMCSETHFLLYIPNGEHGFNDIIMMTLYGVVVCVRGCKKAE